MNFNGRPGGRAYNHLHFRPSIESQYQVVDRQDISKKRTHNSISSQVKFHHLCTHPISTRNIFSTYLKVLNSTIFTSNLFLFHNCRVQLIEVYKYLCTTFSTPNTSNISKMKMENITWAKTRSNKECIFTSRKDDEPPEVEETL